MEALALTAIALAFAAPAHASLPSYCSPSGDVCFGVVVRGGTTRLQITTAARYFNRYTLCVTPPGRARSCGSFPMFRGGAGTWYGSVRLVPTFPVARGVHRVSWRQGSTRLGPVLRFRR